jgi:4-carboxymuconolactone decarboxylase
LSEKKSTVDADAEKGEATRRKVLGDAYADRPIDDLARPFTDLATKYVWGAIWSRPGLPLRTRSLITLSVLTALNMPEQVGLHVKGALRNGCSVDEIQEAILHTSAYCGTPAAGAALKAAAKAITES